MPKIAFVHNRFPAGGAERITIDIALYLQSFPDYKVYVYAYGVSDSLIPDNVRELITVRQIPWQKRSAQKAMVIESMILSDKIDILVQVAMTIPGIADIRSRTGVKTVFSCHGEPFWRRYSIIQWRQKGFKRKFTWWLYNKRRYADGSLAMQKAVARTLNEYQGCDAYTVLCQSYKLQTASGLGIDPAASHIHVIENPEYPVENVNYDKEKIVLFCGRFENWSKRIDRLFRIWAKVQDELKDWKLVLVGDGEDWGMLTKMATDMSLKRVSFEGYKKNVAEYYRKASVVAMTSETEGWPLALTEAQAQGCIGVAFDCTSGVKEILAGKPDCGFIISSFDEDAYATTLLHIASLGKETELTIRKNAVDKVSAYAPEIISEKWKTLFDGLCCENKQI